MICIPVSIMTRKFIQVARRVVPAIRKNQLGTRMEVGMVIAVAMVYFLLIVTLP